jgi:hypothetical protein
MNENLTGHIETLEAKVRAGDLDTVKAELEKLRYEKIPRNFRVKLANLARRVGHHRYALSMLTDIVRPKSPIKPEPSLDEKMEYAVNLIRIGILPEAAKILNSLDENANPEVLQYQAFCHFGNWEYKLAIPLLEKYVDSAKTNPYQKLVGQVNLAAAYINEMKTEAAKSILSEIIKNADPEKNKLIVCAGHQMYAELLVNIHDIKNARIHLDQAKQFLKGAHYRYQLYNDQWNAIADLPNVKNLHKVKAVATQKKVWEVTRACDLYEAVYTQNEELLLKIYFGTPFPEFRKHLLKLYKTKVVIPEYYDWIPGKEPKNKKAYFDVAEGTDITTNITANKGKLTHKLIQLFASDFYRPFKVEAVFAHIFSDEIYNYEHSNHKIYEGISRARDWLKKNKVPLEIANSSRGEFKLETTEPYFLRVKAESFAR